MLTGTKPWYASKTVVGAIVALLGAVLSFLKYEVDAELLRDVADWVLQLLTIVGAAVALVSRVRATKRIAPADDDESPPQARTGMARIIVLALLIPAVGVVGGGCALLSAGLPPADSATAADRATYDAVAPEHGAYIAADTNLTPEQRDRRLRTLETWRLRVEKAQIAADDADARGSRRED